MSSVDIVTGLTEEEQQAEEKKLHAAIGYSENESPAKLPVEVHTSLPCFE